MGEWRSFCKVFCLFAAMLPFALHLSARIPKDFSADTAWFWSNLRIAEQQPDHEGTMRLLYAMLNEAQREKNNWKYTTTILKIGEHYMSVGDYTRALDNMQQAIPYSVSLPLNELSNVYEHIGWVYFDLGDYVTASNNFYAALDYLRRDTAAWPNEVSLYADLGQVYSRLHQYDKALSYYNQGEEYARRHSMHNRAAFLLCAKGEYYTEIHQLDTARAYYLRAKDIGQRQQRKDLIAVALTGMGKTFIESGDYKSAISYLQTAADMTRDKERSMWMEASFYLGKAQYIMKDYSRAERTLTEALYDPASSRVKDNRMNGYVTLAKVYRATGQYEKALDCMDSISVLKDAMVSAENSKAVNLMDIKFHSEEKDKQIAQQNSKIARKNMWITAVGAGTALLLLLLASSYFYMVAKQRSQEKENRISVLNATIAGGESERSRIARELHDGIGGMLSAAMMRFSSLHRDDPTIKTSQAYTDTMTILSEMGDEIRKTAHNLMPDILLKQSLPEALRAFCNAVQYSGTLNVNFQCYVSFETMDQIMKLNIYRITQELVRNVALHAKASNVLVQLLQNEDRLILSVEDNGIGFNIAEVKKGLGLGNVQTRTDSMGGHLTLESTPGKGTTVIIEFTIPDTPAENAANIPYIPSLSS